MVVQPLERVAHIAVLFDPPVETLQVSIDHVQIGLLDQRADSRVLLPVEDIGLGRSSEQGGEQHLFDDVLQLLDGWWMGVQAGLGKAEDAQRELPRDVVPVLARGFTGLLERGCDLGLVEGNDIAVPLSDSCEDGHGWW